MKKKEIVKNSWEFEDIIKNGKCIKNKYYVIHYKENKLSYDRYGISVSKKLGNAVFRNKYKRKIRSIIDNYKKSYVNSNDYIIILRKEAIQKSHSILESEFFALMNNQKKGI
ncbi:MAG: ribonuclease P protein component [Bacilli bacterium]|nr:ribonuclease P protein component [Bacilli bacterium]